MMVVVVMMMNGQRHGRKVVLGTPEPGLFIPCNVLERNVPRDQSLVHEHVEIRRDGHVGRAGKVWRIGDGGAFDKVRGTGHEGLEVRVL